MREILNISLPKVMVKEVKNEVKKGQFASSSEFIRHLIRLWNTDKLARELKNERKKFDSGKGIKLHSLKDLV
ncbi:ribbon-helix-helix protein, CopG family [Candidatus Parcubacteria bacterium]|nr:ribbon-helix-helix protein, CopG family [Candidatus Parcubacteria bacterium]